MRNLTGFVLAKRLFQNSPSLFAVGRHPFLILDPADKPPFPPDFRTADSQIHRPNTALIYVRVGRFQKPDKGLSGIWLVTVSKHVCPDTCRFSISERARRSLNRRYLPLSCNKKPSVLQVIEPLLLVILNFDNLFTPMTSLGLRLSHSRIARRSHRSLISYFRYPKSGIINPIQILYKNPAP